MKILKNKMNECYKSNLKNEKRRVSEILQNDRKIKAEIFVVL